VSVGLFADMRISGGKARSIPLLVPKGDAVRPATDGMREAVFSSLGTRVEDARFLDLFAGSGAYGLEALSRGAAGGLWVEKHRRTFEVLRRNIAAVCQSMQRDEQNLAVRCGDASSVPWDTMELPPNLVFVDPPYPMVEKVASSVFSALRKLLRHRDDPRVVFEMPGEINLTPRGFELVKRIGKGEQQPTVGIFRLEPPPRVISPK
jgi:16S rRNA (guanine966-N2)-methyltransferase